MITEEELMATLMEILDTDMSDGARQYLAETLLEKYILFERPEVEVERDGKYIRFDDSRLSDTGLRYWQEHMAGADREIQKAVKEYVVGHAVIAFYEAEQVDTKAERREELAKESGGTFDDLPGMLKTLIARLVDAEFKNGRD